MSVSKLLNLEHVGLANSLHPRLLRFFQKYPPSVYQGRQHPPANSRMNRLPTAATSIPIASTTVSSDSNDSLMEASVPPPVAVAEPAAAAEPATPTPTPSAKDEYPFNPFLPVKNHVTGRWRSPVFSLRRQAELCKIAQKHGVEDWLPYSNKLSWVKEQKRIEGGLRVKGTGVGQRVKGHQFERQMRQKLEKRRQAMLDMPRLIKEWREVRATFILRALLAMSTNVRTERSQQRLEEMAKWKINIVTASRFNVNGLAHMSYLLYPVTLHALGRRSNIEILYITNYRTGIMPLQADCLNTHTKKPT